MNNVLAGLRSRREHNVSSPLKKTEDGDEETRSEIKENLASEGVLGKLWVPAVSLAWTIFIVLELGLGVDKRVNGNKALCPHSDSDYPVWYWYINMCCLGGFIIIWLTLVLKVFTMPRGEHRTPLIVAIHIVTMGTIATILATLFEAGGLCIDRLGVASPAAIWGEWIASGPLLLFITLTVVSKSELSKVDWFMMITFDVCLWAGLFIIPAQPYASAMFWFLVSCITYLPVLYLPWLEVGPDALASSLSDYGADKMLKTIAASYAQRTNLSCWLTLILPLYTVNYIVALAGGYGPAETIAIYQVLSVLTKGLFAASTMDIHLMLILDTERALTEERRANEARRAFMKFIFHEVRTPLNSLAVGIDMIAESPNIQESDVEGLDIMRAAANFMSKTLDGMLSMHKVEEGKFELEMGPTTIPAFVNSAVNTFSGTILKKEIKVAVIFSPHIPAVVVADAYRLEHVIANLISNAIKFCSVGGEVSVLVECLSRRPLLEDGETVGEVAEVSISVQDNGPGIQLEDQGKLFSQFMQIRPVTLQAGQGSGLGLAYCKNIVTLHNGEIMVVSTPGKGSTFRFIIPFKVLPEVECNSRTYGQVSVGPAAPMTPAPAPVSTPAPAPAALDSQAPQLPHQQQQQYQQQYQIEQRQQHAQVAQQQPLKSIVRFSPRSPLTAPRASDSTTSPAGSEDSRPPKFNTSGVFSSYDPVPPPSSEAAAVSSRSFSSPVLPESAPLLPPPVLIEASETTPEPASERPLTRDDLLVLVVDDAESNTRILCLSLARKNIASASAENGQIALDVVTQDMHRFKLILMDNLMPVMNGITATRRLRQMGYPYLIIGITGNISEGDLGEYEAAGADIVLRKPIKVDLIAKLLSFWEQCGAYSRWRDGELIEMDALGRLQWVPRRGYSGKGDR